MNVTNRHRLGYKKEWYLKNRDKVLFMQKEYALNNRDRIALKKKLDYENKEWGKSLRKNYGISEDDYIEMYINQNGCCKICGRHRDTEKRRLHVDHDHKTGKIRGLLCHHCNFVLGNAFENIEILESAITYLKTAGVI